MKWDLAEHLTRYPLAEFSGGQRQRIGIARALLCNLTSWSRWANFQPWTFQCVPKNCSRNSKRKLGLTCLFIAHDLSVVRFISDRIAVLYKGVIAEVAKLKNCQQPVHPYTQALAIVPIPDPPWNVSFESLWSRSTCDYETDKPSMVEIALGHFVWPTKQNWNAIKRNEIITKVL